MIAFSQGIAIELGKYGIRVNCIAPGLIPTGITHYDMAPVIAALQPHADELGLRGRGA